jgi:DNA-binding HxlR family transcriptional regulator
MENQTEFAQAVEAALLAIGGKWKLQILASLVFGTRRYSELRRLVPQITEKMLIQQLRQLEQDGLVIRAVYPSVPPKVEYSFTEYGRTLYPMVQTMYEWGKLHAQKKDGDNNSRANAHDSSSRERKAECFDPLVTANCSCKFNSLVVGG